MKLHLAVLSVVLVFWLSGLYIDLQPPYSLPPSSAIFPPNDTFPPCGFDPLFERNIQRFPERYRLMEEHRNRFFSENRQRTWRRTVYTIPVVYHIIHNGGNENISEERIQKSIEQLNAGFADAGYYNSNGVDIEFRFCLAKRDPEGNATTGINRISSTLTNVDILDDDAMKALSQWSPTCYVNIWVVNDILEDGETSRIAGYANYPWIHGQDGDGIVCEAKWIGGSPANETVLIHEMGHYFGLRHTFNGGCTNGDCLQDGDQVCDTPPDQSSAAVFCGLEVNSCTTDNQSGFDTDQPDMYENFMDYGDPKCQNLFTLGQKERMIYFLNNWRSSLLTCNSCQDPCPAEPELAITVDQVQVGVGEAINLNAETTNITTINWQLLDQEIGTGPQLTYSFDAPGIYTIRAEGLTGDPKCADQSANLMVQVFCPGSVSIEAEATEVEAGGSLNFTGSAQYATDFEWWINGVLVGNGPELEHQFTGGGTQEVIFRASSTDACDPAEASRSIVVNCPIEASIKPETPFGSVGRPTSFTALAPQADLIEWYMDGALIQAGGQLSRIFNDDGTYEILLRAFSTDRDCFSEVSIEFEVFCDLDIDIRPAPGTFQVNESYTFEAYSVGTSAVQWSVDGTFAGNGHTLDYTFLEVGSHEITFTGISENPNCDALSQSIDVWVFCPVSGLTIVPHQVDYFVGQPVSFTAESQDNISQLTWLIDDKVVGTGNTLNYEFLDAGDKDVILRGVIANSSCADVVTRLRINVQCYIEGNLEVDKALINPGETVSFGADYPSANGQEWLINGQSVSTADDFKYQFETPGTYEVKLIVNYKECYYSQNIAVHVRDFCQYEPSANQYSIPNFSSAVWIHQTERGNYYLLGEDDLVMLDEHEEAQWVSMTYRGILGGAYDDSDGGIIAYGYNLFLEKSFFLKFSSTGELMWQYSLDGASLTNFRIHGLEQLPNGNFALLVDSESPDPFPDDEDYAHIVTINSQGEIVDQFIIENISAMNFTLTSDGGFLIFGINSIPFESGEFPIVKLSKDGTLEWSRVYGLEDNLFIQRQFFHLKEVENNDYLAVFNQWASGFSYDPYVMRISAEGAIRWTKKLTFRGREHPESIGGFAQKPNKNEFVFSISEYNYPGNAPKGVPLFYGKINSHGELIWGRQMQERVYHFNHIRFLDENRIAYVGRNENINGHLYLTDDRGVGTACLAQEAAVAIEKVDFQSKDYPVNIITNLPVSREDLEPDQRFLSTFSFPYCELPGLEAYDAQLKVLQPYRCSSRFLIEAEICNAGNQPIPAQTPVQVYSQDPTESDGSSIYTLFTPAATAAGACDTIQLSFPVSALPEPIDPQKVYLFVNDDASQSTPYDLVPGFVPSSQYECEFRDNYADFRPSAAILIPDPPVPMNLGPRDTMICSGQTLRLGIDPEGFYRDPVWQDGLNWYSRNINQAGSYSITAYDQCGQAYYDTITVHITDEEIPLDLGPDQTICNQQIFTFEAPEGFAAYRWPDGSLERSFTTWESGPVWVEVTDGCGNVKTDTVEIIYDPATVFDLGPDTVICQGETLSLKGIAGFETYRWYPEQSTSCPNCPEAIVTPDTTTTYFLVATNSNGCVSSDTLRVEVTYPSERMESLRICEGEEVLIFGELQSAPGLYSQTFTSRAGCDSLVQVRLEVVAGKISEETISICAGESINIFGEIRTEAGTYIESFSSGSVCDSTHKVHLQVLEPVTVEETLYLCKGQTTTLFGEPISEAGVYEQVFTAGSGCDSIQRYEVIIEDEIRTQEAIDLCRGNSVLVFGELIQEAGFYEKTFPSASGCDSTHQIMINILEPVLTKETLVICEGASTLIFGQEVSEAGQYEAVFPAANGCDSTHQITLNVLQKSSSKDRITLCIGDTYSFFGQEITEAGIYSHTLTAENGCDSIYQLEVDVLAPVQNTTTLQGCTGDSIIVFDRYVYESGSFEQHFTAANGCDSLQIMEVVFSTAIELEPDLKPVCAGQTDGAITIAANSAHQYQWNTGATSPNLSGLGTGTYVLTVTDRQNCSQVFTFELAETDFPQYDILWQDPNCPDSHDGQIQLIALQDGLEVSLNEATFSGQYNFDQLSPGDYQIRIQDEAGCIYTEVVGLRAPEPLAVDLPDQLQTSRGNQILLPLMVDTTLALNYAWTPDQWLNCTDCARPVSTPLDDIQYRLVITDTSGCRYELATRIEVVEAPTLDPPNAFSPNGDGDNETFVIAGLDRFPEAELIIVNRWGSVVYSARPYGNDWDGTSKDGQELPEGTYYFLLRLDITEEEPITGPVTIIR